MIFPSGNFGNDVRHRVSLQATLISVSVAILCLLVAVATHAAAFLGGKFVETDGWKAHISVDCLLKDKQCGTFRYETLGCEGDLIYTGETPATFSFRAELRAGRCLPGCTLQLSSDFSRYTEICQNGRHEGLLVAADISSPTPSLAATSSPVPPANAPLPNPAPPVTTVPARTDSPVSATLAVSPVASVQSENQSAPSSNAPAAQPVIPENLPTRTERTADATLKGQYLIDGKTGLITGKLRIEWDNGNSFDGALINGKRTGKGKFVWANGQSYDGDWRDDVADGEAQIVFANGDRYQGKVKDGVPFGRGNKQFASGDRYEGEFTAGLADVEGTYTEKGGGRYTGQWKSGLRVGRGKFVWPDGQSYDGEWLADKPEGNGTIVFSNGDRYEGQIRNGLPHGKGVKTFSASGDRYEGGFDAGEASGEGTYRWKNGDTYAGTWIKGKKSGMGRYTWVNGDYWEGEFADDRQTSSGRLYFTPAIEASSADVEKLVKQTNATAAAMDAGKTAPKSSVDRNKLLTIPMVAKEVRECSRKDGTGCAERVVGNVLSGDQFPHKWQTMSSEKDNKGKTSSFDVDANSELEGGNVFSWLRSGDNTAARNIGIKYDCRAQSLEIQLIYNCTGQSCTLDPNIEKYAGRIIPATDIKSWFKSACEHQ